MKNKRLKHEFSELRIIGGKWRGRKIHFKSLPGLRPTPDRVRETLFNWLAADVVNSRCLDLFAGSGALGFEALSRGAEEVIFIDQSSSVVETLNENIKKLQAENVKYYQAVISKELHIDLEPVDILFLDPPFDQQLLPICFEWLENKKLLKSPALIYIETELSLDELPLPLSWEILRHKKAGKVYYYLIRYIQQTC